MKYLIVLMALLLSCSVFATEVSGTYRGKNLYKIISIPNPIFRNPHCVVRSFRAFNDKHDVHMMVGNYINSITFHDDFMQLPSGSGKYVKMAVGETVYKNHRGQIVDRYTFRCFYKVEPPPSTN